MTGGSADLCGAGAVGSFTYDAGDNEWTWNCEGTNGATTASCSASELYCGDSNVNGGEQCDDGANGDANDGCNDSCQITVTGVCGAVDGTSIYDFDA